MVAITGFPDSTIDEFRDIIEHFVDNHSDTLIFIADAATTSGPWVTEIEVLSLQPERIVFNLIGAHGTLRREVPFTEPISRIADLQTQLFSLLTHARKANPEAPTTSIEAELEKNATIPTHVVTVAGTRLISKTMAEITLIGLDAPVLGGDEFWYLMVPQACAPDEIGDGFTFNQLKSIPENRRPLAAYYTTRRRRPDDGEIDLWIHLHHDAGVAGWAATVQVGATIALWGPRIAYNPPEGTNHHLLVADETGVPAVAAIAEALPPDHPVTLIAEIEAPDQELPINVKSNVDVRWVHRSEGRASLSKTVVSLKLETDGLYAFGAGESREISVIRRHLRRYHAMNADAVNMTGYWRRYHDKSP